MRTILSYLEEHLHDAGNYFLDVENNIINGFTRVRRNAVRTGLSIALAGYILASSACSGAVPTSTPTPTPASTPIQISRNITEERLNKLLTDFLAYYQVEERDRLASKIRELKVPTLVNYNVANFAHDFRIYQNDLSQLMLE